MTEDAARHAAIERARPRLARHEGKLLRYFAFLRRETERLETFSAPAAELFSWFRQRWLLPRASRDQTYRDFDPETLRLWGSGAAPMKGFHTAAPAPAL